MLVRNRWVRNCKREVGMKKVLSLAVAVLGVVCLNGCATTQSRTAVVKSSDSGSGEWAISATANAGAMSAKITIFINGKAIVSGSLSQMKPRQTFSATYEGKKVDAECSLSNDGGMMLGHKCVIYIDGKQSTELSF